MFRWVLEGGVGQCLCEWTEMCPVASHPGCVLMAVYIKIRLNWVNFGGFSLSF